VVKGHSDIVTGFIFVNGEEKIITGSKVLKNILKI